MASGGARTRSGPAPDPNALRRERKDDAGWVTLPAEGFAGEAPSYPLIDESGFELDLWNELWEKPQAVMWDRLGLKYQVAAYVRAYSESTLPEASAGLKTAVLRMEGELGLSLPGMHALRWKFSEDEVGAKRSTGVPSRSGPSAKQRLAALSNGG